MVEVFRTNVKNREHASALVFRICKEFAHYKVNFDLDDCDRILRVECKTFPIETDRIINLVHHSGYIAEVLEDEIVTFRR